MTPYLLSIYQPDGPPPPPELLDPVMRKMGALIEEAKTAGAWVFSGGLHPPSTATVVQNKKDDQMLVTDGPFVEGKEHLGGFLIVQAHDLDAALEWARKLARVLTLEGPGGPDAGLPIEVRPFEHIAQGT